MAVATVKRRGRGPKASEKLVASVDRAAKLALRYEAALRVIRRLQSRGRMEPAEAVDWASGMRWHGDQLTMTQAREEILWLMDAVRAERPRTVVEIGVDRGGTLFLWPHVAAEDALIVGLDLRPLGPLRRWSSFAVVRRAFALRRQHVELLMPVDTHDPSTFERLRDLLGDRKVDFLFIDADHSYEGVKLDFERFSRLVRPGGIVAFHDVKGDIWPGVRRLFDELSERFESDSLVASEEPRYGIGFVRMPFVEPARLRSAA